MGSKKTILLEKKGHIAYITLNRPEKLNIMSLVEYQLLDDYVNDCEKDDNIRVMIFTGKGKAFSAADDMEWWATYKPISGLTICYPSGKNITQKTNMTIQRSGKVSIAAVNGICWLVGLIFSCDFVIAAEGATFTDGDVRNGICPGSTETVSLTRLLGRRRALEMILTSDTITAQEAYRIGLVNKVVPLDKLMPEAEALARKITAHPPYAIRMAKASILRAQDLPFDEAVDAESFYSAMTVQFGPMARTAKAFLKRKKKTE
ncbi:MAG: enoyl-CoA hydratase/isomerase family protein [Dehalococcoidales bacterium]|nr:enoyl-CoA hydratase/isomerase family protein [Dehalococcoidales bacterium]